jgi:RecA-family ATPase
MAQAERRIVESLGRVRSDYLIPARTLEYLRHGASEGSRNDELLAAAIQLRDAKIPEVEVFQLCSARASLDGLSESEARATIRSCYSRPARDPIEPQSNGNGSSPLKIGNAKYEFQAKEEEPKLKEKIYTLDESDELPEPLEGSTYLYLEENYDPDDFLCIVRADIDSDGQEKPIGKGLTLTRDKWLEKIGDGEIGDVFTIVDENGSQQCGVFISINPLIDAKAGRVKRNVRQFKFALIEFDTISLKQQWQLLKESKLPCSTISYSGNRSLHAMVRVDARNEQEYTERVAMLMNHFSAYEVDEKNKDPSRLTRLPGCTRGDTGKKQLLLQVDSGLKTWDSWVDYINDDFPPIQNQVELESAELHEPPVIVEGILNRQLSMVLGGGSKTFKSFTLLDLAISVANGVPFWGQKTTTGKVLYINFEIHDYFFRERINMICDKKGLKLPSENLMIWNLRGKAQALEAIAPKFIKLMANGNFSLVILDPIYKTLGNRDENAAGDINSLMNEMEEIAIKTGAAVVFAAHFSKGNQAAKSSIDRISGSGVFARSPDTILVMTEHEEDDCFTIESTVRNYLSPEPFVVQMDFPLFIRKGGADPKKLKGAGGRKKDDLTPYIMGHLKSEKKPLDQKDLIARLKEDGFTDSTIRRRIRELIEQKKVSKTKATGNRCILEACEGIFYDA